MKLLAIQGSGRRRGNTAGVTALFVRGVQALAAHDGVDLDVEIIDLADRDVRPCRGCRTCFDRGENHCPQRDDLLEIRDAILSADGLLVTSPVYVNDVSGLIKTWIDRTAFVCHRPAFAGRSAFLIATTGSSPCNHALRSLQVPLMTWGVHLVGSLCIRAGSLTPWDALERAHGKRVADAASRFYAALRRDAAHRPGLVELITFRIQQLAWRKRTADALDYAYWRDQGWTELRQSYFVAHRTPWPVVWAARLVGTVVAQFLARAD